MVKNATKIDEGFSDLCFTSKLIIPQKAWAIHYNLVLEPLIWVGRIKLCTAKEDPKYFERKIFSW